MSKTSMDQYTNHDGVLIQAELLAEDAEEHAGLWHTVDADGNHGYVDDELFQRNWTKVEAPADAKPATE
jgi:hypothetical protein